MRTSNWESSPGIGLKIRNQDQEKCWIQLAFAVCNPENEGFFVGSHWYSRSIWDAYYGCSICLLPLHIQDTQLILLREVGELGEFGLHLRGIRWLSGVISPWRY